MRLTQEQAESVRKLAAQVGCPEASVWVFGSRLDDDACGGDLDLSLTLPGPVERPALLAASLAPKVSHILHGRKVDVVIDAPNLARLPIHEVALKEGVPL